LTKITMRESNTQRRARLLPLVLLAGLAALAQAEEARIGGAAPALKVPELTGASFDLGALRGKVVIVNFWATWCSPCRAEMPVLDAFYRAHRAQGVELLGLSIDEASDQPKVREVMQRFSYPAALMAQAKENGFGSPVAVPITYVIDAKGVIRERILPGRTVISAAVLDAAVLPLLPKLKGAPAAAK
jgi:thiol-disulfide isomerase/thioredoxin